MQLNFFWHVRVQLASGSSASRVRIRTQNPDPEFKEGEKSCGAKLVVLPLGYIYVLCCSVITLIFLHYNDNTMMTFCPFLFIYFFFIIFPLTKYILPREMAKLKECVFWHLTFSVYTC